MSAAAPTPAWDTIAALRPRLASDVQIHRHSYRGVPWHVVQDGSSTRHMGLDEGAWRIVGLMDGKRTLDEIYQALATELDKAAPTREIIARVVRELHAAELLEAETSSDASHITARRRLHDRLRWRRLFASPFSQHIPLFDPQAWLEGWLPTIRPVMSLAGLLVWLAVVLVGLGVAIVPWGTIMTDPFANVLSSHNLVLMVVAYLVVKVLHELGHAFATRAFGGEVHEIGIMLLVFMPIPYVDASASSAFPEKGRRMAVAAAGIMVEVFLAVLALMVWLVVEPGLVRDFAWNVVLVGGVSTVLFNGNPLLRFDGYYVLCDALEIPNLGTRSKRYLGYLVQRYLCGAQAAESPVRAAGERFWFVLYGITSSIYRVVILTLIVLFVAQEYPVVGVALGVWAVVAQLVLPMVRGLTGLVSSPVLAGRQLRTTLVLGGSAALVAISTFTVPLPAWTYGEGVVWLPEHAQVRAGAEGFLIRQIEPRGIHVESGTPLFALDAKNSRTRITVLEHRLDEYQARYDIALFRNHERLDVIEQQLVRVRAELENARKRAAELLVRSPSTGILLVPDARQLEGRYVHKGELLGYVTDERPQTVRVVLRQDEIDQVREDTRVVQVKFSGYPDRTFIGQIDGGIPSATRNLPGVALGVQGGGRIAIDGNDREGRTAADSVFVLDVMLPPDAPRLPVRTRVYLRFKHAVSSLSAQITRAVRRLLLTHWGV